MIFGASKKTSSSLDTRILVIRAQNGNAEAFGELYQRFANKIYRFLFFKVDSRQTAEDLCQEVFLKAYQNINSANPDSFQAWLFPIARHHLTDHYRTQKQSQPLPNNLVDKLQQCFYQLYARNHKVQLIKSLLPQLKPEYQDIILLRIMQELSVKETAAILNLKPTTVRVRTHRALAKLKSLYEKNHH